MVKLKPYKWSDGETVTVQDVMFWMNMLHSDKTDWAGYAPELDPRRRQEPSPSTTRRS